MPGPRAAEIDSRRRRQVNLAVLGTTILFSLLFYFNSYLCDDAFIEYRMVDNFVRGYGLRWNVDERVQAFTANLHTLLMCAVHWLTHDRSSVPNPTRLYFSAMAVSYAISLAAIGNLFRRAKSLSLTLAAVLLLMSSQAFVTFTSSGLGTPLIYLFVILFYQRYLASDPKTPRDLFWLLLVASFSVANRLDSALLFLPACIHAVIRGHRAFGLGVLRPIALASLPMLLWFGFALTYFGFLLPNTYYAKLGMQVDPAVLRQMGRAYLALNFLQDPITLFVTALGVGFAARGTRTAVAGLSVILHLAYVYGIGADNLGFRFLAPPFLLSVLVIRHVLEAAPNRSARLWVAGAVGAFLVYGFWTPGSPLRAYRDPPNVTSVRFYFDASNLARWRPGANFPFSSFHRVPSFEKCRAFRKDSRLVSIEGGGLAGFCAGAKHHMLMPVGLTDPLVARLPVRVETHFYPGHVSRSIPAGYVETLRQGRNQIRDRSLAAYYDKLSRITRGPLFSAARWRDIVEFNFTSSRRYAAAYVERNPPYPRASSLHLPSLVDRLESYRKGRR